MYLPGYDPATNFSGDFNSGRTYYVSSDGWYAPNDFDGNWPSSPSAYLVASDNRSGWYPGNYMNWLYYNASAVDLAATIGHLTRIQTAKIAVSDIITVVNGVRFGIWGFNGSNGGKEITALTTNKVQLLKDVNAIVGDSYTPRWPKPAT